jgi:hypothetical protein
MSVFVVGVVLGSLAHGGFRSATLSRRELYFFLGGIILLMSGIYIIYILGVHPTLRLHWYFPSQPVFIWLALFHGVRDFRLWKVYGLPFPLHLYDKVRNA